MYVACPACKSLYVIQPAHLRAAGGELRCGGCGARFNATAAVFADARQALDYAEQQHSVAREIDELVGRALGEVPEEVALEATGTQDANAARVVVSATAGDEHAALADDLDALFELDMEPAEAGLDAADATHVAAQVFTPVPESGINLYIVQSDRDCYAQPAAFEFTVQTARQEVEAGDSEFVPYLLDDPELAGPSASWGAIAVSLLLIVLLGGQAAWHQRYQLAEAGELRPVMEQFCELLRCDLPLRREPVQVEITEREVRDHPTVKGALLINAAFVNRATFRQAYPVFQISFSDVSGTLIALRRFPPQEYLLESRSIEQGMGAGDRAHIMLEVIDPGVRATSFQFEFF